MLEKVGSIVKMLLGIVFLLLAFFSFIVMLIVLSDKVYRSIEIIIFVGVFVAGFLVLGIVLVLKSRGTSPNPYVDVSLYEMGDILPEVRYPGNLFLLSGEQLIYAVPASIFTDGSQVVGYTGQTSSGSYENLFGQKRGYGRTLGSLIRKDVRYLSRGDFLVTTNRLLFIGAKESFEIRNRDVTAINFTSRKTFYITAGGRVRNIAVHPSQTKYAAGLALRAVNEVNGK